MNLNNSLSSYRQRNCRHVQLDQQIQESVAAKNLGRSSRILRPIRAATDDEIQAQQARQRRQIEQIEKRKELQQMLQNKLRDRGVDVKVNKQSRLTIEPDNKSQPNNATYPASNNIQSAVVPPPTSSTPPTTPRTPGPPRGKVNNGQTTYVPKFNKTTYTEQPKADAPASPAAPAAKSAGISDTPSSGLKFTDMISYKTAEQKKVPPEYPPVPKPSSQYPTSTPAQPPSPKAFAPPTPTKPAQPAAPPPKTPQFTKSTFPTYQAPTKTPPSQPPSYQGQPKTPTPKIVPASFRTAMPTKPPPQPTQTPQPTITPKPTVPPQTYTTKPTTQTPYTPPAAFKDVKPTPAKVPDVVIRAPPDTTGGVDKAVKEIEKAGSVSEDEALGIDVVRTHGDEKATKENLMNIVMVGMECAPWSKTGGLGDVMQALPKALAARGHRVMTVVPRYGDYGGCVDTGIRKPYSVMRQTLDIGYYHQFIDGVDYVFVDHGVFHNRSSAQLYDGNMMDIMFRCVALVKSALEAPWHVPCGGTPYGDGNLLFIANDWHTALLPVYLQAYYRDHGHMEYARSVFVIHNLSHQGRGPMTEVDNLELSEHYNEQFRLYDPVGGEHMNLIKSAIINSQRVIAVSQGYAWECTTQEGGWGLDGVLNDHDYKLSGVTNGIDLKEWHPAVDSFLTSDGYMQYNRKTWKEGKAKCKAALQKQMGLPVNPDVPLVGFIGRLDGQKGVDLIQESYEWLMGEGAQLIMLGSGREDLENGLRHMQGNRPQQCVSYVGFSVELAHRMTAGLDILLMPSRFEPCGLNQLYAMTYGTVPVVHAVGGLRDTVQQYDPFANAGTGWTFTPATAESLRHALGNALYTWRDYRDSFNQIIERGMAQDLSWSRAAKQYEEKLLEAKYIW